MEPETQIFLIKMIVYGLLMAILLTLCFWIFECILTRKKTATQVNVFVTNGNNLGENGTRTRARIQSVDDVPQRSWVTVSEISVDLGEETDVGCSPDAPPPSYEECMKLQRI